MKNLNSLICKNYVITIICNAFDVSDILHQLGM